VPNPLDDSASDEDRIDPLSDAKVVDSWDHNAEQWTKAVRENRIESRSLITNQAILDAVESRSPHTVLDIGCGEGWLLRALASNGVKGIGVDVVPALIEQATRAGGGDFRVMSYEAIAAGALDVSVDVAVANFSLIGEEAVEKLVSRIHQLLVPTGSFVIQTLHPLTATGDQPYEDGWRQGSWAGFSSDFTDPAPWYFRTMQSWLDLLNRSGFSRIETREPIHPITKKPVSVIFITDFA
jgi:2-polyprenyl-3-methyl-5-hydroxy-6-metoxy-1,4-benzoquinol methylase